MHLRSEVRDKIIGTVIEIGKSATDEVERLEVLQGRILDRLNNHEDNPVIPTI